MVTVGGEALALGATIHVQVDRLAVQRGQRAAGGALAAADGDRLAGGDGGAVEGEQAPRGGVGLDDLDELGADEASVAAGAHPVGVLAVPSGAWARMLNLPVRLAWPSSISMPLR
jgi:hypothetical protein